jgi:hypothetical protein
VTPGSDRRDDGSSVAEEMARIRWDYDPDQDESSDVPSGIFFRSFPWETEEEEGALPRGRGSKE